MVSKEIGNFWLRFSCSVSYITLYCVDGNRRLLVYEFMPLGSLEDHLHGIVHPDEHFGADGDWRSISIHTVRLPNVAIVAIAKCKQPNKNYGAKVIAGCNTPTTNSKK